LQQAVAGIVGGASRVTDLFAGCGTLGLPFLKDLSRLAAAESDTAALAAMKAAVDSAGFGARRRDSRGRRLSADQPADH